MFITAESIDPAAGLTGDVCIIGAGAAGITLARDLAGSTAKVILLEAGEEDYTDESQDVYEGVSEGYLPLYSSRLRFFGGTTNHWAGYCRPYNRIDFETREWIPRSGWPIDYDMLFGYLNKARPIVEIPPDATFEAEPWSKATGGALFDLPEGFYQSVSHLSPPTRFAIRYRDDIEKAENVSCVLRANVTDYIPADGGKRLDRVTVTRYDGESFPVRARFFVMAMGGIENARALLIARTVNGRALGASPDLVGRFFMDHVGADVGVISMPEERARNSLYLPWKGREQDGVAIVPAIETTEDLQRREQLTNINFVLMPGQSVGMRSFRRIAEDIEYGRWPDTLDVDIVGMVTNFEDVLQNAGEKMGVSDPTYHFYLRAISEVTPNPESRVMLGEATDRFGQPRTRLVMQPNEIDRVSVQKAVMALGQALGEKGIGRLKTDYSPDVQWGEEMDWGYHHCGTTRMSESPADGVVDPNLRMHGVENLYIAGSSVFPVIGATTPTWPIVALTLRLGDHLRERMSNES